MKMAGCHIDRKNHAHGLCRSCYNAKQYESNLEYERERSTVWRKNNPERAKERSATWRTNNPEYASAWRKNNLERSKELSAIWRKNNSERSKELSATWRKNNPGYRKDYHNKRIKKDVQYKLSVYLRSRINSAVKNRQKVGSAVTDLGCSINQFRLYIENQFERGMSWDNYGEWHLDHIQSLSSFDLTDRPEFLVACNWLNYQPLWARDNLSKGNRT